MEAIQALQLQTDAKHRRITGQVMKRNNDYCTAKNGQNKFPCGLFSH